MKRKIAAVLALSLVCVLFLGGCSLFEPDPSTFPSMDGVEIDNMTLAEAQNDQIKVSYDTDFWAVQENSALITLLSIETMENEFKTNINVQVSSAYEGPFKAKDRNALYQTFSSYGYTSFDTFELRRLDDEVIIYADMTTKFTEKNIDQMIKKGLLTEEYLEVMGGRDYLLTIPTTYQTMIYTICDGHICVYTGTCYDEEQKAEVLEQILVMIDTTKVLIAE